MPMANFKEIEENKIKKFYQSYSDKIRGKRLNSPFPLRRYVHQTNYLSILRYVNSAEQVLEVGCGEGILSVLMAQKGAQVTGLDISRPNLKNAKEYAGTKGLNNIKFIEADAENLPFGDNSFDVVVADNVLEHLPNFEKGLSEIKRVTKKRAIIVLPTCLNPCAWCLLGRDNFWKFSWKTPFAIFIGFLKITFRVFSKGINQGYANKEDFPHLWRYPCVMKKEFKKAGFKIINFEAVSICLPYFNALLPLIKFLDKHKKRPFLRNFGYGSIAVLEKIGKKD
jgi:ubiquinone/menaquinone biosynthesis C-methylase UbiE